MEKVIMYFIWLILSSCSSILTIICLNIQTNPYIKNSDIFTKLMATEIAVTIMWSLGIPTQRFAYLLFTPVQIALTNQLNGFLMQLLVNAYWFNLITPIDDYVAMTLILIGITISKTEILN